MATIFGNNQSIKVTAGYLNAVDDAAPGSPLTSPSGSIVKSYDGQLGQLYPVNTAEALSLSKTATGTLYAGVYQYVKFKDQPGAVGVPLFWDDVDAFIVTAVAAATNIGKFAGVAINCVSANQYGFMQVMGTASVKYAASLTKATPADGDLVMVTQTPAATFDVQEDATAMTQAMAKSVVGTALAAPVANTLGLCLLDGIRLNVAN